MNRLQTPRGSFKLVEKSDLFNELGEFGGLSFQHEDENGNKYEIHGNGTRAVAIKVDKF